MVLDRQVATITPDHPHCPASLRDRPSVGAFYAAGPIEILNKPSTGFLCSSQCPGAVILKTFDAITALRDQAELVIGGFHSPMEWGCFEILLRGRQPVIWVPARSIQGMRLKAELRPAFSAGRLLILSPFQPRQRRITADLAEERNRFVAAVASQVFAAHAAPSSRTFALCKELLGQGKPVVTVNDPANGNLLRLPEC
jgi:predicted Rossmann fold nucleotide-binding protein DprA/Smf involved in DNA uptake